MPEAGKLEIFQDTSREGEGCLMSTLLGDDCLLNLPPTPATIIDRIAFDLLNRKGAKVLMV